MNIHSITESEVISMFVQMKKFIVTEGSSKLLVEKYEKPSIVENQDGFVERRVLVKKGRGDEEVLVLVTWESEEHWKKWEKSDAHIAGHKVKLGQPKAEYILSKESSKYEVKVVRPADA